MNKKLYLLPFLIFAINAQENTPIPVVEPVITDLDLLVESVKTTASIRASEDRARLNKFLSDKSLSIDFAVLLDEKIIDIEPGSFYPPPKVRSTLLVFVPKKNYFKFWYEN